MIFIFMAYKMTKDAIDPIHYLEMMFGRFVNDSQLEEHRKINYIAFAELVNGFAACGVYKDIDQFDKACAMQQKLKQVLHL